MNHRDCSVILNQKDFEDHYNKTRVQLEKAFNQGLPKKLSDELIEINQKVDKLSLQVFDMNPDNPQEINLLVQKTIEQLEKVINLIPKISNLAPKMRKQYVMPFTNMNFIGAEHQNCLTEIAIEEIQNQNTDKQTRKSGDIYKKLISELDQMNQNLYKLQTTRIERFIGYHSQLLSSLEKENTKKNENQNTETSIVENISKKIPLILNSVQTEIDKIQPSLQLSKTYYSLLD